ncbi:hypothetical protein [Primorskyibacter sp. S87]|uniref:hypothetical protein n=1 Tax=Primorskyibacter sp. S87 TaxID=3415126 RepID=UPI003C7A7F65
MIRHQHIDATRCAALWQSVLLRALDDATSRAASYQRYREAARSWLFSNEAQMIVALIGEDPEDFFDAICRLSENGWLPGRAI